MYHHAHPINQFYGTFSLLQLPFLDETLACVQLTKTSQHSARSISWHEVSYYQVEILFYCCIFLNNDILGVGRGL